MSDDTDTSDPADDEPPADAAFERELATARALLDDADDVSALHVGVVRGDRVDSTAARRSEGEQAGLETLTLLASHLRTVADEAGVDYETVAADAAGLAGQVDELPTGAETAAPDTDGAHTDAGDAAADDE
ncbi:hypothetical protein [Halobaculum lipolyticum]|uniref:DUF8113 domain-containing protein n=1 Tax=Halobaculum lipolyticum TaxID=3032001 RepID=A0ABD5WFN6_9EURY|nr:hypothetical protein [Halobaculum sp. DT31]